MSLSPVLSSISQRNYFRIHTTVSEALITIFLQKTVTVSTPLSLLKDLAKIIVDKTLIIILLFPPFIVSCILHLNRGRFLSSLFYHYYKHFFGILKILFVVFALS